MSGLVLTVRKFHDDKGRVRFDWNLRGNGEIVSGSRQTYSRRIDCARGAEVGAGLRYVVEALRDGSRAARYPELVEVRLIDEREVRS